MDFRELSKWTAFCPNWTAFCPNRSKNCPKKFQKLISTQKSETYPQNSGLGQDIERWKNILKIIIFREKLKKKLYSLIQSGQKAVQITNQANNVDRFMSIWSASWPILEHKDFWKCLIHHWKKYMHPILQKSQNFTPKCLQLSKYFKN